MYHKVEVDFRLNLLKARSYTIESSNFPKKCFKFKIVKEAERSHNSVKLEPEEVSSVTWLYGPATDLATKNNYIPM